MSSSSPPPGNISPPPQQQQHSRSGGSHLRPPPATDPLDDPQDGPLLRALKGEKDPLRKSLRFSQLSERIAPQEPPTHPLLQASESRRAQLAQYSRRTLRSQPSWDPSDDPDDTWGPAAAQAALASVTKKADFRERTSQKPDSGADYCNCFAQCIRYLFRVPDEDAGIPQPMSKRILRKGKKYGVVKFASSEPEYAEATPPPPVSPSSMGMSERVKHQVGELLRSRSETGRAPSADETFDITSLRLRLDPTRPISKRYQMTGRRLGQGGYASVYEVADRSTGEKRAVKIISKLKVDDLDLLETELGVLLSLDHPNVIRLLEWFEGGSNIYLIMECCDGGELFDLLDDPRSKNQLFTGGIIRQICQGVAYLHQSGVVHRDLKLENCLFKTKDEGSSIKLIDFGLAGIQRDGLQDTMGTALYMAPEVVEGVYAYDEKCDIWAVGVIMYLLLTGVHPFWTPPANMVSQTDEKEVFRKVMYDSVDLACIPSSAAAELVSQLLEKDPSKRLSAKQALQHRFLRQLDLFPATQQRKLLRNLRSFSNFRRLERAVLTVIAFSIRDRELEHMRETFALLDKDCNGSLSKTEIINGMRRLAIEVPDDLSEIVDAIDADQSGQVDYTEFVAAVMGRNHVLQTDAVDAAFNWFDQTGDGRIDRGELEEVAGLEDAKWALDEFDIDRKNYLDRNDFERVVKTIAKMKDISQRHRASVTSPHALGSKGSSKRRTMSWSGHKPRSSDSLGSPDSVENTPTPQNGDLSLELSITQSRRKPRVKPNPAPARKDRRRASDAPAYPRYHEASMSDSSLKSSPQDSQPHLLARPSPPPIEITQGDSSASDSSAGLGDRPSTSIESVPSDTLPRLSGSDAPLEVGEADSPLKKENIMFLAQDDEAPPPPPLWMPPARNEGLEEHVPRKHSWLTSSSSSRDAQDPAAAAVTRFNFGALEAADDGEDENEDGEEDQFDSHFDVFDFNRAAQAAGKPGTPLPMHAGVRGIPKTRSGIRNPLKEVSSQIIARSGEAASDTIPAARTAPELYPVLTIFERSYSTEGGHLVCSGKPDSCGCPKHLNLRGTYSSALLPLPHRETEAVGDEGRLLVSRSPGKGSPNHLVPAFSYMKSPVSSPSDNAQLPLLEAFNQAASIASSMIGPESPLRSRTEPEIDPTIYVTPEMGAAETSENPSGFTACFLQAGGGISSFGSKAQRHGPSAWPGLRFQHQQRGHAVEQQQSRTEPTQRSGPE